MTAVTDAKAFSDKEALDGKLIDIVAASKEDLLAQLERPHHHAFRRHDHETGAGPIRW